MRVAVGADHAGYALKQRVIDHLTSAGHVVSDFGTHSTEAVDYPDFCAPPARAVAGGHADVAIVLGGSGQGEQIVANKVNGIRAALCNDLVTARLAREHNDANVLSIGARLVEPDTALQIVDVFLSTAFEGGRHVARVRKIAQLETEERGDAPPRPEPASD